MLTLTPAIARQFNENPNSTMLIPETEGVLVVQVVANSPAAQGGLRRGDVITQVEATGIKTAEQLQKLVEQSAIGKPLIITVQRGEQVQQLSIRPQDLKNARQ
jgi:S1-C subfamily serine protease